VLPPSIRLDEPTTLNKERVGQNSEVPKRKQRVLLGEGNKKQLYLKNASATCIRRHKKIKANANPFDPQFKEYFQKRAKERKTRENTTKNSEYAGLNVIQPYEGLSAVR